MDPWDRRLAVHAADDDLRADAAQDPRIVELAEELMRLIDGDGARTGKYTVDVRGAQGVQIGDRNAQTNTFTTP